MQRGVLPSAFLAAMLAACAADGTSGQGGSGGAPSTSATGGADAASTGDGGAAATGPSGPAGTGGGSGQTTSNTSGGPGTGTGGEGGAFVEVPSTFVAEPLDHHRNRLLDTLAQRRGAPDRCALWSAMTIVEKGVLLTHTDMLGHRSCFDNASVPVDQMNDEVCDASGCTCDEGDPCQCPAGAVQAIDHVFSLWAVNGSDLGCCTGTDCCNGGGEWHRTYFSADDALIAAFRATESALPEWSESSDFAGPHDPFTQSDETQQGTPRGQVHFWASDAEAEVLDRTGVEGVLDPHVVEMDQDFNILHDSNPEGTYSGTYGRAAYKNHWDGSGDTDRGDGLATTFGGNGAPGDIDELVNDAQWLPTCGPRIAEVGAPDPIQLGSVVTISGDGFAASGNRVLLRTRTIAIALDASSPYLVSESSTSIRVRVPMDVGTGEAFVMVESGGVLTNVVPVSIAP